MGEDRCANVTMEIVFQLLHSGHCRDPPRYKGCDQTFPRCETVGPRETNVCTIRKPRWASYTSSSSSLLLQEEEELVEVVDPMESRGSSWLFLFVEPSGFTE